MTATNAAPASRRRLTSCGELFALGRGAAMLAAPSRAPLVARRVFMYSTQPRRASRVTRSRAFINGSSRRASRNYARRRSRRILTARLAKTAAIRAPREQPAPACGH